MRGGQESDRHGGDKEDAKGDDLCALAQRVRIVCLR
jgi:hypothetical protein